MTTSKDEALEKWWAKWREADFTWEGLAKKPLQGWVVTDDGLLREAESGRVYSQPIPEQTAPANGREATLQDYWRADPASGRLRSDEEMEGELVVETELAEVEDYEMGTQIHEVHRHPTFHLAHLPLAYADGTPTGKADWPDNMLDGIVLPRLAAASETRWDRSPIVRNIVGPDRDAQLQGGIWFKAARLPNRDEALCVRYNLALIFRYCDLTQARFSGDAGFDGALFGSESRFSGASFSGSARFIGALFCGRADFGGASFSGDAEFLGASFSGDAWFSDASFSGRASFTGTSFSSGAQFSGALFSGGAQFIGASFYGGTRFSSASFGGDAAFTDASFSGSAGFESASFSSGAWFRGASFSGAARFSGTLFGGAARFITTQFSSHAYFDDACFQVDVSFAGTAFDKLASFEKTSWSEEPEHWHGAFGQVLFRENLDLLGAGFRRFAAFDGATLERGIRFDEIGEKAAKAQFKIERRAAIAAARTAEERDARLRELERGCRVLKLAFERAANKSREQLLYRFELQARRAQRDLPPGEALFSDLYALASDYGASMVRPFLALAFLLVAFAAVFCGFAEIRGLASGNTIEDAWQAFDFSLANVFKPLSALSADAAVQGTLSERLLTQAGYGWTTGVRALAILQSVLAIVLAFLFALAVRRRFQIS